MARPAARVLTLLELLQSGGVRTVTELAGWLGVDGRTVRRYVDHLLDLDVPVESVRRRYDWLPAVLASLDRPFVIERPDELRGLVVALAERLAASARAG